MNWILKIIEKSVIFVLENILLVYKIVPVEIPMVC